MPEFWVASGHHFARRNAAGRLLVTDELILAWLARPEVLPPADACAAERALHSRLMDKPRAKVSGIETGRDQGMPMRARTGSSCCACADT